MRTSKRRRGWHGVRGENGVRQEGDELRLRLGGMRPGWNRDREEGDRKGQGQARGDQGRMGTDKRGTGRRGT